MRYSEGCNNLILCFFRVEPVSYQQLTGSHLVSVSRSLVYTASLSDHNNSISCRVIQKNLQSDRIIYARSLSNIISIEISNLH